jgi:hypothetical protein
MCGKHSRILAMPLNTALLLLTPRHTITSSLRLQHDKACFNLQPLSNGRPRHPSRLSLLMWYITALIRQGFPQGLVQITCLIDDRLPLRFFLKRLVNNPPPNTPGVSYLLFHALHFSSPVINPMFFYSPALSPAANVS